VQADLEFDQLVHTVIEPVRRYLNRRTDHATADDITAEVLVVLWRRLSSVPAGAEVPWAIGIARLQLNNFERAERRRNRLVAKIISADAPTDTYTDEDTESDERADEVRSALGRLRRADAEILRLHAWDELTTAQIAIALGISSNAVSIRLHRAKQKFIRQMRNDSEVHGHVQAEGRN
jgi:RNA polymerase sigma-70 factor (ECF subfamily)